MAFRTRLFRKTPRRGENASRGAIDVPGDAPAYPCYMGGLASTVYSGDAFFAWSNLGHMIVRTLGVRPEVHLYEPSAFQGYRRETSLPWLSESLVNADQESVMLDGGPVVFGVRLWVQPSDIENFVTRLESAGVPRLASTD